MTALKERVLAFLVGAVTAGHRAAQSLKHARAKDRGPDWKGLRADVDRLERRYHDVRNFLEHLIDVIAEGVKEGVDCSFSTARILTCKLPTGALSFDFTAEALAMPRRVYEAVIAMLEVRESSEGTRREGRA